MVTVYCTYLTLSAVSMEPDDNGCNPLVRSSGTRTVTVILGALITMATIAYTTTRAATQGITLGSKGGHSYVELGTDDNEHGLVTQQPSSRREMRAEALHAAIESGSLPASALDDSDDEDDFETSSKDDERGSTQYSYSLFHIILQSSNCMFLHVPIYCTPRTCLLCMQPAAHQTCRLYHAHTHKRVRV